MPELEFYRRPFNHQKLMQATCDVHEESLHSFLEWSTSTGYMLPKPEYKGLKMSDGSEWAARYIFGDKTADSLALGTQLCLLNKKVATVVP
jgi:hypothetical protein